MKFKLLRIKQKFRNYKNLWSFFITKCTQIKLSKLTNIDMIIIHFMSDTKKKFFWDAPENEWGYLFFKSQTLISSTLWYSKNNLFCIPIINEKVLCEKTVFTKVIFRLNKN